MVKIREKLIKHPLIGTFVIMILYGLFLYFSRFFVNFCFNFYPFIVYFWIYFFITFFSLAFLFFLITPRLYLPNGKESFGEWLKTIHLSTVRPLKRNLFLGFVFIANICLSVLFFVFLIGSNIFNFNIRIYFPSANYIGIFFVIMLIPGIWEEVAFRGIILTLLLKKYSEKKSIAISSVLFGLAHFFNLISGADLIFTIVQVVFATLLGISFAYTVIKTESLLPCIITHYSLNTMSLFFFFTSFLVSNYFLAGILLLLGVGFIPCIVNILIVKFIVNRIVKAPTIEYEG